MVVAMFPKVAGMKVESSWGHGKRGFVRCIAWLTRSLTAKEAERLRSLTPDLAEGNRVTGYCRPQAVEAWQENLTLALGLATQPAARRVRRRSPRPIQ